MAKGKRKQPSLDDVLERPWCYYCERDFDDLKILVSHQKAKHYRCEKCNRRLQTAGGLSVHMAQVHKETLTHIENALPNRQGLEQEIFGMEGIPEDIVQAHNERIKQEFFAEQGYHASSTGNPPPGGDNAHHEPKKPRVAETTEEMKKRLAEFRAAKKAAAAAGESSTPTSVASPSAAQMPGNGHPVQPAATQSAGFQNGYPHAYGQPPTVAQPQPSPEYYHMPPHLMTPQQMSYGAPMPGGPMPYGMPMAPYAASPSPAATIRPGMPGYSSFGGPSPGQGYPQFAPPMHHGPPAGMPAASSPAPPQRQNSLPAAPGAQAASSLPPAPGLPARPSFDAPQQNTSNTAAQNFATPVAENNTPKVETPEPTAKTNGTPTVATPAPEAGQSKKQKKSTRMIYSDDAMSLEEKMAGMKRYAFTPKKGGETFLAPVEASATGVVRGPDDVGDAQG